MQDFPQNEEARMAVLIERHRNMARTLYGPPSLTETIAQLDHRLALVEAIFADSEKVRILERIIESYADESRDRREFDRSLRVSIVTMVISVLVFSVAVPLIQHWLVG